MIINSYIYGVAASYDVDAQAFFNAESTAGVTLTTTQKDAVNTLVVNLKAANIWTKMKAVYPIVGGTATAHKFNLKNPADTNAAFRLVFNGGWTHSANGALPNGTNAYADTKLIPSSNFTNGSVHVGYYSRTNVANTANNFGTSGGSGALAGAYWYTNNNAYLDCYNLSTNRIQTPNTTSLGLFTATRTSTTSLKLFRNNAQLGSTVTGTSSGLSGLTNSMVLSAYYPLQNYDKREVAFFSMGDGLTDAEVTSFYTAVQTFQTTLGRQV